jgi:general secretion pathway protein H
MPTLAAGNKTLVRLQDGFTLLELLVVITIMAIATGAVSLALRDSAQTTLERDAVRLAAVLEAARAQSRASGARVLWTPLEDGFRLDGLPQATHSRWLSQDTTVLGTATVALGPEPLIGPQQIDLISRSQPASSLRLATDGLRPFALAPWTDARADRSPSQERR